MNHMHVSVVSALSAFTASVRIYPERILPLLSRWVNTDDLNWCLGRKWRMECKQNQGVWVCVFVYDWVHSCMLLEGYLGLYREYQEVMRTLHWLIEWWPCWSYYLVPHTIPKDRSHLSSLFSLSYQWWGQKKGRAVLMTSHFYGICFLWEVSCCQVALRKIRDCLRGILTRNCWIWTACFVFLN